ncbi:hypothetical protein H1R20_g11192, partial [Candolleomyces eurysporus]
MSESDSNSHEYSISMSSKANGKRKVQDVRIISSQWAQPLNLSKQDSPVVNGPASSKSLRWWEGVDYSQVVRAVVEDYAHNCQLLSHLEHEIYQMDKKRQSLDSQRRSLDSELQSLDHELHLLDRNLLQKQEDRRTLFDRYYMASGELAEVTKYYTRIQHDSAVQFLQQAVRGITVI